ncbi:hypothetical protein [Akkermansia muciniphila]|uniref:ADP-ribosyltransferase-containing protein n=1 Tax=Akkermansia muciniphila TaxID=239935 RepID=UPI001BFFD163|nr:hypothetical protein [Akkermansia muciniphila]
MFETDFFPLAQEAKHSNLLPESFDHLQENDAPTSLQDWGQVPGSRKLPEFKPDESRLKLFSALALGDDADEEAKGLVKAEGYQPPVTPDEEACLGLDVCVSLFGLDQAADPYLYWARQGKEAPQFKDMGEAHRAVWQDFSERTRVEDAAYKERTRRVQQEQEEISRRIVDCVAGKEGSWDACPADLLKYAESPQKAADSIMRARRAYAFAERRGFEDVWRSDALDMADLLTVNVNGNEVLDQQALMLLMTAIDRKVQESQTDSAAFWRNLYRSFADTARGAESLGVKAVQAVRGIPGMSGMEEWYSNNIAPLQGVKDTFDGQRQLFDRYEQRREALNTMQDVMHEFGQRMRGTSPDASWYVKAINGAGNITGQSLSYMAPGGWALALAGDMGHAGNAASRNGDSLVDVTINGLRNTVEEKGFGVFSVFGRMGAINKLMTRTGTGALARLAAKVPGRTFFAGTRTGKMLSTPAFAYVEEMAAEPLAGELFEWTARKLSGMTGMEVKPKDFEVVSPVLQAMGDVEQSGGCALFVAAMAAGHAPRMKQEVAAFVTDAQRAQLAGYTKKHAEEMASFSTAEHKAALAQKYFETDVLKDPEGAAERARKAGAELADRQEARLYQMSGALDKVLEKANIGRIRKLEGTDRYEVSLREGAVVNGVKMEEDRSVEMNEEQTDALVQVVLQGAYLNGVRVMQDAVLGNAAISEAGKMDFIETLDMLSEEAPAEYRKAAAETGGMTVPGLMDVAARAQARIDAIVREEGVSVQEARSRTDAEVMGKVQLGSIADLAAAFERRLDHAVRSGEITRGRSDEIRNGTAAASFAHRFTMATDPGSSLLLYAGGHVTTANVMEDVQESALVHYMNLTGKDWQDLWEHLQAADAVLGRYGVSLGTYEGPAHDARDVVESFSNLSLSSSLADIESLPVPQWVKDTAEFALKNLEDSARIIRMGEQWNEFAATDEGKKFMEEHGGLAHALQAVGVSTESVFRQARMDAAQKLDVEMVHADLASRRAPGDATMTLGELEALEESMARMDAAEDVEETAEEEDETDPVTGIAGNPASPAPLVEDAGGSLEGVGEEAEHDEEAGAEFRDHAFVRVAPDCVFAQVRVDSLALAPDVEQFKQGDHNERGAVKGRELQGRFREDAQPISVWRRRDGALHVITGRHRFDLAVRDGVEFIPAYVYEEDDAHDATWAKMHDVGQNMLDGQASALEVAFFVRNSNMGRDEMEAQGYLRPGSANVMGWDIATLAGDEVFTRLKNGVITDNEAWKVCRLSSTEAGQMLALQLREKGKPWDYVAAYVKEADRVAAEKSREGEAFDLFGNDTSWQEDCEKVARFAARGISLIAERLSLLKKSRGISRRKDLAGRMGIRLETDADLNAAIHDLERAKGAWQSHDPALRLHDRALAWDGTSEVNPFERVPVSGATFSVVAMDSSGTVLAPETFVTRKDGSPDWFVIPRRKGQPAMPVRLLVGSDIGEHRGYGLTHILASRGFSFWKDRSPERYISSILANVSELYEVAPGRELLVKGRQPSSWMLLQLDRKDGFYSIVSAYPVRQGKKPLGKKLPLAERQPANANSGTARLGPGSASKAALPSQSAGGGDGFSLPQGAHVVNVNEVECRFDDGAIVPATFSLSLEKEAIKKEAVAAGTFMKAPNGKETNLTEDQWLSVRTAAFKNWFGDWEHDPENASKVVDENGEPRVVYHGTYGDFTVFDKARIGSATDYGIWGRGFYFTNMENTPYGNKKLALFLNFRNPFIFNDYKSAEEIGDYLNIWDGNFHEDDRFGIFRPYATGAAQIADSAQERGHDGLIAVLGKWTEYIAFEPNQIKSATDNRGTFDPKNPDITFSVIGPNAATWGKYADKTFAGRDDGKLRAEIDASQASLKAPENFPFLSMFDEWSRGMGYRKNPVWRGLLEDVLNFDELYEAYPSLRKMYVFAYKNKKDSARGYYDSEERSITINLAHIGPIGAQLSTLLHEIQHAIQDIEGFARGSNLEEGRSLDDYMRSAGEIESRNVEKRILWDGERRESKPFNDTLEFPGEAIVSFSIASAQEQGLFHDGHFEAGNAVITEPGVTFSIAALHASPHSFRKFSTDFMGKGEGAQAHNYVIFNGNDIKITAFADESTGGAWADYEDPTASFSLATRESVWVTLEREAQKNRLEVLRSQTAKALETWRRVCAANDVKQGDGAEAFGRVMAVVASIYKTLPEGYRFGLYPYMRAAENLATRLEDGQVWLSDELKKETLMDDTSERMDAVIDKLLARTLEQADRYAVDQMRAEMVARIKAVQPTKKASGKFNKGKLSAEDYRHLHGIVAMMNTDQEAKEKRMLELEGVLSSNQSTEEERGAAELELKDWHTFGYLAGMGLEQTRACARALALFITTGRTAWSTRLDEERRRTKFKAEKIVEGLGQATPQGGRDAEEDAKASTRTKAAKYLKYGLQSYSQLLNGWKKIPALRGLAHAEVTAIAEANVALRNMKHARDREVTALVKRCFGVQRTKDVARVLSDFKKTGDSGVVLNPLVKVERTVRIAEAREWVGLSFEEREERRKAIRKEYNDRGLSDDKASVPEALIPEMRRQLAELDELVKAGDGRARRRKNITAKAEVVRPGRKGETLKVSRAQAMYAILLYEQAEYVETMRNEGIGEAEVARLREFVGAEGLAFGYGLRELMNRQGKLLARVYEEREGVPFPAVENYFRAVFRADHKLDTKASFGEQTNAVAGGAKYGMLIPRRKHNLHLAWNMDCEAVFQAASAEVENYICTADITARWRGILADKEAAASLKEHMGRHGIDSLRHWLDVIDGAGVMEGGALLAGAQATSRFQSAKAVALLAWNVLTMLKQTSGLMHGMFAGEVGMGSFLLHLGQTMSMTGRMGVFEMMKTEAFRARTNDAQAELVSQLMGYASDQNYTGAIRFSMAGMRAIEKMDVWSNAVSMAALYNAKWSELEEAGKRTGAPMTEDEMHALCMQSVTRALELVAQPLTQSQKSMLGASTGLFAKMACFMSSEVLNKVGMIVSHVSSGNWGQALALYGMMSVAEQTVIALWHALLDDEDEWEKNGGWFGAMLGAPVAMIGGVPMLGAAVEFGYKQATGQRIYAGTASGVIDYSAIYRAAKNTWKAVTGEKEMTFADWAELILLDAKAAAYVAGAGAGSRSKAADSVASWLLSVAGVANLSKPGFKLAE